MFFQLCLIDIFLMFTNFNIFFMIILLEKITTYELNIRIIND